jgi:hypothetical protein
MTACTLFLLLAGLSLVGVTLAAAYAFMFDQGWKALALFIFLSPIYPLIGLGYSIWLLLKREGQFVFAWSVVILSLIAAGISYLMGA